MAALYQGPLLVIPREARVRVSGDWIAPGECALASSVAEIDFAATGSCLITQPIAGAR